MLETTLTVLLLAGSPQTHANATMQPQQSPRPPAAAAADTVDREAAGPASPRGTVPQGRQRARQQDPFRGGQRQLNQLNPEISMTGDFVGWVKTPKQRKPADLDPWVGNRFILREAQLNVVAPLDPFTRGKFFVDADGEGSFGLSEGYMEWLNLPGGVNLKIGKFLNQFAQFNRWHDHALPQADRPPALVAFLGDEGLGGVGLSANMFLPSITAHVNEITLEYISGYDGGIFGTSPEEGGVAVGRLKNYWDVSFNSYVELGLSGAWGYRDPAGGFMSGIGGVDLTYKWLPVGSGRYEGVEIRAEALRSRYEDALGSREALGGFISVENRLDARWLVSGRFDWFEEPSDPDLVTTGGALAATCWQSEFVFFRFQLSHIAPEIGDAETRLIFQATWAMGPHKHEKY